ncbi:unnamed protein product, partial [Pylaiella littoralis]
LRAHKRHFDLFRFVATDIFFFFALDVDVGARFPSDRSVLLIRNIRIFQRVCRVGQGTNGYRYRRVFISRHVQSIKHMGLVFDVGINVLNGRCVLGAYSSISTGALVVPYPCLSMHTLVKYSFNIEWIC